ncbi:ribonuclease inhibitor-like, partial [Denticeps clupeoides]|uniref:ribonuclease inhibitor-like n=1 Tax=Denticeps clupeoides TaxID=299321 RepID=UPI0010A2D634
MEFPSDFSGDSTPCDQRTGTHTAPSGHQNLITNDTTINRSRDTKRTSGSFPPFPSGNFTGVQPGTSTRSPAPNREQLRESPENKLGGCNLTASSCKTVAAALQSPDSHLTDLDLSYNKILDSGVEHICVGLESSCCKLETLRLCNCSLSAMSCSALSSALRSNSSRLRILDLSFNNLQDSGVELLSTALEDPHCKLETLQLYDCSLSAGCCSALSSA